MAKGDDKLFRCLAEFYAADERRQRASDKTFKLGEKPKPDLPRLRKAEAREEKLSAKADRAWYRVWKARATSLKGLTAKANLRRHWNLEDEESEMIIYKSIIADIEAMN